MTPLIQNVPAGAESGVYAILALLADPAAYRARLDELKAHAAAANQAQADAAEAVKAAEAKVVGLEATGEKLKADHAGREKEFSIDLKRRAAEVTARENAVAAAQTRADELAAEAAGMKATYEGRLADLRRVAGAT